MKRLVDDTKKDCALKMRSDYPKDRIDLGLSIANGWYLIASSMRLIFTEDFQMLAHLATFFCAASAAI